MEKIKTLILKNKLLLVIFFIAFLFSWWLMFSSFSYNMGFMQISSKSWSDFASHIPLIRSFSLGSNFPPQYPLFPGPHIKYHFIFFALVGLLEKMGIRIDYAFNIPSIIGFTALILIIYIFSKMVFKSAAVGVLSILFFIFNGSLNFIKFFTLHPLSANTISDIVSNQRFISFGPYDNSIISAFWSLNIYTNQRHLAMSYAVSLILIFFLLKPHLENKKINLKTGLFVGILFGLSFFLNIAVFVMTGIIFAVLFIFAKNNRLNIFIATTVGGLIGFFQYLFLQQGASASQISFYAGYLANNNGLTLFSFLNYWFQNLGLHFILIPLGFILAPKRIRQVFLGFFALFIIGNLFKFSPEIAANHKFFNLFMIIGAMFSSYAIYYLWIKKIFLRPLVAIIFFLLIFSGIIDFFPIFNDYKINLADYPVNKDISWIIKNTKPNSVFLNTNYLYTNASLAGRKIFLGWPYFAWSQGYNTLERDSLRKKLLTTENLSFLCKTSYVYKIEYIEEDKYNPIDPSQIKVSSLIDSSFKISYENKATGYKIYSIDKNCIK